MTSRRCTILLTVAVLMLLVGCSCGNSPGSAGGGSDDIRFHKKHGASFNHCRGAGRGVPKEIHLFVPEASRARSAANCRCWHSTLHIHFARAMATSLIKTNRVKSLVKQVPYEDFALV